MAIRDRLCRHSRLSGGSAGLLRPRHVRPAHLAQRGGRTARRSSQAARGPAQAPARPGGARQPAPPTVDPAPREADAPVCRAKRSRPTSRRAAVEVTSGFTGHEIIVFGAVDNSQPPSAEAGYYDVVVVVEGTPFAARRAPEERRRRRMDQHLVRHFRRRAELLRHRLDAADRGDRRRRRAGAARHRLRVHAR